MADGSAVPEPLQMGEADAQPSHHRLNRSGTSNFSRTGTFSKAGTSKSLKREQSGRGGISVQLAGRAERLMEGTQWGQKAEMEDFARGQSNVPGPASGEGNGEEDEDVDMQALSNDVLGVVDRVESSKNRNDPSAHDSEYGLYTARPAERSIFSFSCFRVYDPNRDIVDPNACWCTSDSSTRRVFMRLAVNRVLERLWLMNSLAHNSLLLVDQHVHVFIPPMWTSGMFMGVYLVELVIKSTAFGLWGARYAYLNYDIFNRVDFVATCSSVLEFVGSFWGATYTLRGFRLFRFLRPLLKIRVFQDMGTILSTLEIGAVALGTVVWLILFVFVLFSVVGMEAYGRSFVRRCVWADTMELKQPQQWCKRYDENEQWGGIGLDSSCGPLQLCLDVGGLGFGFAHFNHMAGSMLSIFQAFSTDGQYDILWACLQSEPAYQAISFLYWIAVGVILGQILVNVFLAVLASVFTRVREEHALREQRLREAAAPAAEQTEGGGPEQLGAGDGAKVEEPGGKEGHEGKAGEGKAREGNAAASAEDGSGGDGRLMRAPSTESAEGGKEKERVGFTRAAAGPTAEVPKGLGLFEESKEPVDEEAMEEAKELRKQMVHLLPSPRKEDKEEHKDTHFHETLSWIFRSKWFELVTMVAILGNSTVLAMLGSLSDKEDEETLLLTEFLLSVFFLVEVCLQVACDGSLSKYFEKGEHVFEFLVQLPTMAKVVAILTGGADTAAVGLLRALGILRLLRASKYFMLRPIWLMLVRAAESWMPAMNLVLFIIFIMSAWTIMGRELFQDAINDPRANFDTFFRGFLTLFQVFTGDSWSAVMYNGMMASCAVVPDTGSVTCLANDGLCVSCTPHQTVAYCLYFILFFWLGQYVFITMFLALILERFSVTEFMTIGHQDEPDELLNKAEAKAAIADFQKVPEILVNDRLVLAAFMKHTPNPRSVKAVIEKKLLIRFVKRKQPKRLWRLSNWIGFVACRRWVRVHLCCWLSCCKAWPGDPDWGKIEDGSVIVTTAEDGTPTVKRKPDKEAALAALAFKKRNQIREYMDKIVKTGMAGEVRQVADSLELSGRLANDIVSTSPDVAIKVLRHETIAQRLGIAGMFRTDLDGEEEEGNEEETPQDESERVGATSSGGTQSMSEMQRTASMAITRKGSIVVGRTGSIVIIEDSEALQAAYRKGRMGRFREFMQRALISLANSNFFHLVVYSSIIVSSIFLAMETPAKEIEGPLPRVVSEYAGVLFAIIFIVEAVAKIGAFGFFMPTDVEHEAYWQDRWNRLDFVVVCFTIADLAGVGQLLGSNATRVIKVTRAIRPLRLMGKNKGMKTIIGAIMGSMKPISYATLFLFMITTVFGVIGMALFRDKFWFCTDTSLDGTLGEGYSECLGSMLRADGIMSPRAWTSPRASFDTFPKAILTLSRAFTLKWVSIWHLAQDAVAPGVQPVENYNVAVASIFFVLFIFVGSFFALNLFVSFVVDGFYAAQGVDSQFDEIQYSIVKKLVKEHWPRRMRRPPRNIISAVCRAIVMSNTFKFFSASCLMLNITLMASNHEGATSTFQQFIDTQNNVFFGIMCAELVMTIVAYGPKLFVDDAGNLFDLFLVVANIATILFASSFRGASQGVRVLRLVRFLRTMKSNAIVESVFETVTLSLKQVGNILVVLFLFLSVFAVVGVSTYGTTRFGNRMGTTANFRSYPWAMLTLFQIMFGDEWHVLMEDCQISPPDCTKRFIDEETGLELSYGDCGSDFAPLYFVGFVVICNFTMINLFVGMIINNFSFCSNKGAVSTITPEHIMHLRGAWVECFDHEATGFVPLERVYGLMLKLMEPLGFYGTDGNNARYLCIREDLKRTIEAAMEEDTAATRGEKLLAWLRATYKPMQEEQLWIWQQHHTLFNEEERTMLQEKDAVERRLQELDGKLPSNAYGQSRDGEDLHDEEEDEEDEDEDEDEEGPAEDEGRSRTRRGQEEEEEDEEEEEEEEANERTRRRAGQRERATGGNFGSGVEWHGAGADEAQERRRREVVWMCGEDMGKKPKRLKGARSRMRRGEQSPREEEEDDYDPEEEKKEQRAMLKEFQAKQKTLAKARKLAKPKTTFSMRCLKGLIWIVKTFFVNQNRGTLRPAGHVRFDEVVEALLYWNRKDNIVPSRISDARQTYDDQVIQAVAQQFIVALLRGFKARKGYRQALATRGKLRDGQRNVLTKVRSSKRLLLGSSKQVLEDEAKDDLDEDAKREMDEKAKEEADAVVKDEDVPHDYRRLMAKGVQLDVLSGSELTVQAQKLGMMLPEEGGVFGLQDMDITMLLAVGSLAGKVEETKIRADVDDLVKGGLGRVLTRTAADLGMDLPKLEKVVRMPLETLRMLHSEAEVQAAVQALWSDELGREGTTSAANGGRGVRQGSMLDKKHGTAAKDPEVMQLKDKVEKKDKENQELARVLVEAQRRLAEVTKEKERLQMERDRERREGKVRYDTSMVDAVLPPPSDKAANGAGGWMGNDRGSTRSFKREGSIGGRGRGAPELAAPPRDGSGGLTVGGGGAVGLSASTGAGSEAAMVETERADQGRGREGGGGAATVEMTAVEKFDVDGAGNGEWVENGEAREKTKTEERGKLEQALSSKRLEVERLQRQLKQATKEEKEDRLMELAQKQQADKADKPARIAKRGVAFDPSKTQSMSTAAALGVDLELKKPEHEAGHTPHRKKTKQTPAWL